MGVNHCPDPRYPHPVVVKDGDCKNCGPGKEPNGNLISTGAGGVEEGRSDKWIDGDYCISCCNKFDSFGWSQIDKQLGNVAGRKEKYSDLNGVPWSAMRGIGSLPLYDENADLRREVHTQGVIEEAKKYSIRRNRATVGAKPVSIPQRGNVEGWNFTGTEDTPGWSISNSARDVETYLTVTDLGGVTGEAFTRPPYSPWLREASDTPVGNSKNCLFIQTGPVGTGNGEYLHNTGPICNYESLIGDGTQVNRYEAWSNVERDDIITAKKGLFQETTAQTGPGVAITSLAPPITKIREYWAPNYEFIETYS